MKAVLDAGALIAADKTDENDVVLTSDRGDIEHLLEVRRVAAMLVDV